VIKNSALSKRPINTVVKGIVVRLKYAVMHERKTLRRTQMMPKKNSFLLVLTCAMAMLMMAGRCDDDDDKAAAPVDAAKATEALPSAAPDDDTLKANPESGVEKDPIGETLGGDDAIAPLEDAPAPGGDDSQMLDDPSFEPEPVPDEATDL
jgi:hypothetical protein